MAIIQDLGPNYSTSSLSDTNERANTFYTRNITMNLSYWTEATYDLRFFIGEQGLMTELYGVLPGRPHMYTFNRILRVINTITGFQRRNRKSLKTIPIENADQKTADQFSKILFWADQQESIGETVSDAFEGACVTGMYLLHPYMDYRKDPINGDIKVDSVPYNAFIMDTFTRKPDLSDCNGIMRRSFVSKEVAMSLLPDYATDIAGMASGEGARDGKFQYMPEAFSFDETDQLTYDEFYYRSFRSQKLLVDTINGETMEWTGKEDELLKLFLQRYPSVTVVEQDIPTVRMSILLNNKALYDNQFELDNYPFVPVFTYFNPEVPFWNWRVQGVVRQLRDAQYLYNRRRITELDILESRVTNAMIYKPDNMINPEDIYQTGQGRNIPLKPEVSIGESIQPLPTPEVPASMIELSQLLAKEVTEISGVNEELLGSATDDKAGILSMLRQGAGITQLQGLYDKLDFSYKQLGRLMIQLVQKNFTPGKVRRILGEEPTQEFYNKNFSRYDCAVEEGLNTTTQKQNQFATLLHLKEVGIAIPDSVLLESVTVQNKTELIEAVEQQNQQAQRQQQMQEQVAMADIKARTTRSEALAAADTGLYYERTSRVAENLASAEERKHEAAKDDDIALLNLVKSLKELESVDIAQVEKLIALSNMVKAQETPVPQSSPPSGIIGQQPNLRESLSRGAPVQQSPTQVQSATMGAM